MLRSYSQQLDLCTDAAKVAVRLQSIQSFVASAHELRATVRNSSPPQLQKHARKIIALIEIARGTLTRAGIKLHTFTSCPPSVSAHKDAYFDLLRALKAARHELDDPSLRHRIGQLLLPLHSWFIIHRGGSSCQCAGVSCAGHASLAPPPGLRVLRRSASVNLTQNASSLMPPPDAFPSIARTRDRPRGRSGPSSHLPARSAAQPLMYSASAGNAADAEDEEGDDEGLRYVYRSPSRQRFGIFCTGKRQHN